MYWGLHNKGGLDKIMNDKKIFFFLGLGKNKVKSLFLNLTLNCTVDVVPMVARLWCLLGIA